MKNKKVLGAIGAVAILLIVLASVYLSNQKEIRNKTLITAFTSLPQSLNPVIEQKISGIILSDLIFDGLTNRSGKKMDSFPLALALEFRQHPTNLKLFNVKLNTAKVWHDDPAHKFSAKDVLFTYQAIINPKNNSPLRGRIEKLIQNIEVIADDEIAIYFKSAIAISRVGWVLPFKIIPETYYGKKMSVDLIDDPVAKDFARAPIGTGNYKLEKWEGNQINFTSLVAANDFEKITINEVSDPLNQTKMLIDGDIDLILQSDMDLHERLNKAGMQYSNYTPYHYYAMAFNTASINFQSKYLRQAITESLDKAKIAKTLWPDDPKSILNHGPFPHNANARYRNFPDRFPLNKAHGKEVVSNLPAIKTTLVYPEGSKIMARIAGMLVQDLKELGITVEAKAIGLAFDNQLKQGNYELALIKQTGFTKNYRITPYYRSDSLENITKVNSPQLDENLQQWEDTAFWIKKLPKAQAIHEELVELSPYAYLFSIPTRAYYSPTLQNVKIVDPVALMASVTEWKRAGDKEETVAPVEKAKPVVEEEEEEEEYEEGT